MSMKLKPYTEYKDSGVPWLGGIPAHWSSTSVKRHFSIQLGKMLQGTQTKADERPVNYLKAQHVQWFAVRISELPTMWASPYEIVKFGVQPGDLLVCEGGEGGRCGIVKQLPEQCIIQNALHRVRPIGTNRAQYLQYVMSAIAATGWFAAINNKATIAHFTHEKFGALGIPVPPSHEQDAIATFLAHSDHLINHLIRTKRRMIALLNEQKQAIIQRAVTRGLDPYVRLKHSGVEWLGTIPEHWEILRTKYLYKEENRRSSTGLETQLSMSQRFGLIPSESIEGWRLKPQSLIGTKICKEGDLVLNRLKAHLGVFAVAKQDGIVSPDYSIYRPVKRVCNSFYEALLRTPACRIELRQKAKGIVQGFWRLYTDDFYQICVPFPPPEEQQTIMSYLEEQLSDINRVIERTYNEIDLVREYRARLIADVVTGKLDVRGVNVPEMQDAAILEEALDEMEDSPDIEEAA
jgi:type I restriction enzyme, S subunit